VSEEILNVTDSDFEDEIIKADLPVLVDCWAVWCGPCRMVDPLVEQIAQEYAGQIKVAKLNVDENQSVPAKYGIMSIPTLLFFKGGDLKETIVGALPKAKIIEKITPYL
jgi:thioredoxin 1